MNVESKKEEKEEEDCGHMDGMEDRRVIDTVYFA